MKKNCVIGFDCKTCFTGTFMESKTGIPESTIKSAMRRQSAEEIDNLCKRLERVGE